MTRIQAPKWSYLALVLSALLVTGQSPAATVSGEPVITSMTVVGTNLVFDVVLPVGTQQGFLEMRPTLTEPWQEAAQLNVPADGGNLEFTIPMPALDTAFFRLKITTGQTTNSQPSTELLSTELQYVAIPSLGPADTKGMTNPEAVFHFKGLVDGSDRIRITREGAFWEHVNWGWPDGAVTVNGSRWNPQQKNYLTTTGGVTFLPAAYSLSAASLEVIEGRDVVALERTNDALIVYLDDTPSGAAMYDFKIHFRPAPVTPRNIGTVPATLKIAAVIDGSDELKITAHEATWQHRAWAPPGVVKLNDIAWDLRQTNVLVNAGTNTFLPPGVDFSTAKVVSRQGRDVGTMWADADALRIQFADNPNGADYYGLEISFGQ
jgi:hypothetical protein